MKTDLLVRIQAVLFAVLFAIWALPETILIRNVCLVLGGLIGIYQIYTYRTCLANKKAVPIFLIIALFVWSTFHLLFLSNNFALQLAEYASIWKRSLIGAIFALGFGLGIVNTSSKTRQWAWIVFYIGLLLPTLIYILKFGLLYCEKKSGANVGSYWHIYIAKTAYMGFCIPALAVALGQIYFQITNGKWLTWPNFVYAGTIPAVLFVIYAENIKNGALYSFLFITIFIGLLAFKYFKRFPVRIGILLVLILLGSGLFIKNHIKQNHSWETFLADAKVATQDENSESWKCKVSGGSLPTNELGEQVSDTNYSRVSWGINALKLIPQYPFGYGLVERSFGHIGKQVWPGSCLSQSHSGWLDLTLGIGIPGMLLLLGSLILSLKGLLRFRFDTIEYLVQWRSMSACTLICFGLIWCTTEISQKVFFDELVFFLALAGAIVIVGKSSIDHGRSFEN
ncbi:hypothetical protein G6656_06140 [Polynucleobacter paneuropaeus]|nr:hypothetical protein [Polynucleobacter paneuropaeus]